MAEGDLVGGIGDGLIGGGTGSSDGKGLYSLGKLRQQGDFPRDVGCEHGLHDGSVDDGLHERRVDLGALEQLRHAALAKFDGGE